MTTTYNFIRYVKVVFGKRGETGRSIENLRVDFEVTKNSESNPNDSVVKIFNLNETSRGIAQESEVVYLYVGYKSTGSESLLLYGDVHKCLIYKDGLDIITEFRVKEGGYDLQKRIVSKSYSKKAKPSKIIMDALESMKFTKIISKDKIQSVLDAADKLTTNSEHGSVIFKKAKDIVDQYLSLTGLEWSIQNGEFVILGTSDFIDSVVYDISAGTGLVGSPTYTDDGCDFNCVLLPSIRVGGKIKLTSKFISGTFKIKAFSSSGSNISNQWETNVQTKTI